MDLLVIVMDAGLKGYWAWKRSLVKWIRLCLKRKLHNDLHPMMNNATCALFLIREIIDWVDSAASGDAISPRLRADNGSAMEDFSFRDNFLWFHFGHTKVSQNGWRGNWAQLCLSCKDFSSKQLDGLLDAFSPPLWLRFSPAQRSECGVRTWTGL